jgi:acyl carrier protein
MSNDSTVETALWAYLQENHLPKRSISYADDVNLFDAGIIDSAGLISFICFIEEKYGISIPDEDLLPEHFSSVSTIASYIREGRREMPDRVKTKKK